MLPLSHLIRLLPSLKLPIVVLLRAFAVVTLFLPPVPALQLTGYDYFHREHRGL